MEIIKADVNHSLSLIGDYWKDDSLFQAVVKTGFNNVVWEQVPDELLIYLYLHDEPTLGKKRSEKTKKEYFRDLHQFHTFAIKQGGFRHLHPEDVRAYQYLIEEKGLLPTTLRRKSTVIKQFLSYLYTLGIVKENLTVRMKKQAVKKENLVNRDLYEHEVRQLLDYFQKKDWFAFTLLYTLVSTGLRIEELANAKWLDLFYYPKNHHYFLTVIGKGNKERQVVIFEDVLEVLREYRARKSLPIELGAGGESAFFPKADGTHYSSKYLSNEFTRLIESTQDVFPFIKERLQKEEQAKQGEKGQNRRFRITPHTCRHFTAAYFSDKGIPVKEIRDMLGHASFETTNRYLRRKQTLENHAGLKIGKTFL